MVREMCTQSDQPCNLGSTKSLGAGMKYDSTDTLIYGQAISNGSALITCQKPKTALGIRGRGDRVTEFDYHRLPGNDSKVQSTPFYKMKLKLNVSVGYTL